MTKTNSAQISRREFVQAGMGVCFGLAIPFSGFSHSNSSAQTHKQISAWVNIKPNGEVVFANPAAEMGQGSMTALAMIFAEELDVDWNKVHVEFSPADDEIFMNPTPWVRGIMLTLGSSAVSGYYEALRVYGAQARKMLLMAVARQWQVPLTSLTTEAGVVLHTATSRSLDYGEAVALLKDSDTVPAVDSSELKAEQDFRIIGKNIPRVDVPAKVNGSAQFSIDVDLPGMLYAALIRSPVNGSAPVKVSNHKLVESRAHILNVALLPDAVAIVAENYDAALRAEKEIDILWSESPKLDQFNDAQSLQVHLQVAKDRKQKGMPIQEQGDIENAMAAATTHYNAEYLSDYLYHAQMEPLNAVADVSEDGKFVEVWAGTQAPTHCLRSVAKELDISVDNVNLHRTYLGGGFGRRGAQDQDYVIDAVKFSSLMKRPVKVIWSRETDVRAGRFKPIKAIAMRASENAAGDIIAWHHRTVSDEALKQSDPYRYEKAGGWPVISSSGMATDYDIANVLAEILDLETGVRAAPHRGIGGTINKFASESFLDEIASAKDLDPLTLRLQLLHKHEIARRTLETVAEMSDWKNRGQDSGLGLAFDSVYYPTAYVVKVEVDKQTGAIKVPVVWVALDVGIAIHPENIRAQLEGQIIFGISNVLKERVTINNGAVEQSNFHDYPVLRMSEIPEIHIRILTRPGSLPTGVGDARIAALPAAIANGFASVSGKRLRHTPFIAARVRELLST